MFASDFGMHQIIAQTMLTQVTSVYEQCIMSFRNFSIKEQLEIRRQRLLKSIEDLNVTQTDLNQRTLGEIAIALAHIHLTFNIPLQSVNLVLHYLLQYLMVTILVSLLQSYF
jgi:hypothetical protein